MASALALLAVPVALGATPETPKPGQRIDMKVLLLTSATTDTTATTWEAALKREGVPYEKLVVGTAGVLTDAKLADYSANRAFYQAVVVAPGNIADPGVLPAADLAALTKFQTTFGIRQLSDNTFPNAAHGLGAPTSSGSQDGVTANLTDTGRLAFPYLKGPVTIDNVDPAVDESFGYLAQPLNAANFQTLLTGPGNAAFLGVFTHPEDGREEMVMTLASNEFQTHNHLLRHGMLSWVTRGVYLGHQRNYFEMQVDDIFIGDDGWDPEANVTSFDEADVIRMNAADVDRAVQWSRANGLNTDPPEVHNAFKANANEFRWINHTFTHPNLDCSTRGFIAGEINQNKAFAQTNGLPVDPSELVTGEHSGLANTRPGNPGTIDPPFFADEPTAAAGGTLPAGSYDYGITARSSNGETIASVAQVTTAAAGSVDMSWEGICHAVGYEVYRRPAGSADGWVKVGSVAPPNPSFTDAGPATVTFTDTGAATSAGAPPASSTAVLDPYGENPAFAGALSDAGIRVIASDNSKDYPQATAGRLFTVDPNQPVQARAVPRYPSNVYYNTGTRTQQLDEYNYIYLPPELGGACVNSATNTCRTAAATWQEYVDSEVRIMFGHMMGNDPRPHYFHEANIAKTADPEGGVMYQVVDALLARYRTLFADNAPIRQLSHTQIADELERQSKWLADVAAGRASGYIQDGRVHVSTTATIEVPLTGTTVGDPYGGQRSGWTTVSAGSELVVSPSDPGMTGRPSISGAAVPGTTLTASPGTWAATGPLAHAYQWQRCDAAGASCEVIAGATGTSYQVLESDRGKRLRVVVSAGNWISSVGQEDSLPTAAVGDPVTPPPPVTGGGGGSGGSGSTSGGPGGQTGGGSQGGQAATAPRLTGLAISPKRFAVRKSATIRWTLDRAASLSVRVERVLKGRKVGIRCRPDSKRLRKRSPCIRYVSMGTIKRAAKKGSATLKLARKVGRRTLQPGSYRLVVSATDAKGNRSAPRTLTFTVVRR